MSRVDIERMGSGIGIGRVVICKEIRISLIFNLMQSINDFSDKYMVPIN